MRGPAGLAFFRGGGIERRNHQGGRFRLRQIRLARRGLRGSRNSHFGHQLLGAVRRRGLEFDADLLATATRDRHLFATGGDVALFDLNLVATWRDSDLRWGTPLWK